MRTALEYSILAATRAIQALPLADITPIRAGRRRGWRPPRSRYMPHQSAREKARRRLQIALLQIDVWVPA